MYKHTTNKITPASEILQPGQFIGHYTSQGGNYYQNTTSNLLIKVCERKQPTALKPRLYVVNRTADGKFPFVSSLYPQPQQSKFTAEINRTYFNVEMTDQDIIITQK
jgi:hypothetical protein